MDKNIIIFSDVHLGSKNSRVKELQKTLEGEEFDQLILLGDIFDDLNFKKFKNSHWNFLNYLRSTAKNKMVIWVVGNHDGPSEILTNILGILIMDEYIFEHHGIKYLATHGHQFDHLIRQNTKIYSKFVDLLSRIYNLIQYLNRDLSKFIKKKSKEWLKVSNKVAVRAVKYAEKKEINNIICGHTHIPGIIKFKDYSYYNTGSWTEVPSSYIKFQKDKEPIINYVN